MNWFKDKKFLCRTYEFTRILKCSSSGVGFRKSINAFKSQEEIPTKFRRRKVVSIQESIQQYTKNESSVTAKDPARTREISERSIISFNKSMSDTLHNSNRRKSIALEGVRLIQDALLSNLKLEKIFIVKKLQKVPDSIQKIIEANNLKGFEIHLLNEKRMKTWSSVTTPPGIIGIFKKPNVQSYDNQDCGTSIKICQNTTGDTYPITILCNQIREPGNLGSILRTAAGAGCKSVILSKGCVDPWDTKVIRGGCGAHFRIPIEDEVSLEDYYRNLIHEKIRNGDACPIGFFIADSNVEREENTSFPLVSYSSIDYSKYKEIFVVIGGETEGVSKLLSTLILDEKENPGLNPKRIYIKLSNRLESLNAANAIGILIFEIQRQLKERKLT